MTFVRPQAAKMDLRLILSRAPWDFNFVARLSTEQLVPQTSPEVCSCWLEDSAHLMKSGLDASILAGEVGILQGCGDESRHESVQRPLVLRCRTLKNSRR